MRASLFARRGRCATGKPPPRRLVNHESGYAKTAAAHLLRDAESLAQWAARGQQAAEAETRRAAAQAAALRASRARWEADADESEDSEDDEPTADEEELARAAVEREELHASIEAAPA